MIKDVSILGLGLIGGSIAKGIKKFNNSIVIYGYDKPEVTEAAVKLNVIDEVINNIEDSITSDIIFLCLPALQSVNILERLGPLVKKDCIITDVCGVKGVFEDKWKSLQSKGVYCGGHPMAGSNLSGLENSDPLMFQNAAYIISTSVKDSDKVLPLIEIIESLGARIKLLDPYVHDKIVAQVSHLPQLLAVALVNACEETNGINYLDFAAGGFRDMTRIASSNYTNWEPIIKSNKKEIIPVIDKMQKLLNNMKHAIHNKRYDEIGKLFESAKERRDCIPKNVKGFLNTLCDIFISVKDEKGVLSKIATELYNNDLNINDIELLKIREGVCGSLRLSFKTESEAEEAKKIISDLGYEVR